MCPAEAFGLCEDVKIRSILLKFGEKESWKEYFNAVRQLLTLKHII